MWLAPELVGLLAPGFAAVPGKFELAVHLTRIMFPFLLLIALAAQATGMLNSHGSFGIPAIASIFFNIGSVGFGLAIGYLLGPHLGIWPIEGMAYGVVVGGALQFGWQRSKLHALGYRFRFIWNWSHPGLRRIATLMLPAIIGNLAAQINLIINTSFASELVRSGARARWAGELVGLCNALCAGAAESLWRGLCIGDAAERGAQRCSEQL